MICDCRWIKIKGGFKHSQSLSYINYWLEYGGEGIAYQICRVKNRKKYESNLEEFPCLGNFQMYGPLGLSAMAMLIGKFWDWRPEFVKAGLNKWAARNEDH